jgi:hypothetical protein
MSRGVSRRSGGPASEPIGFDPALPWGDIEDSKNVLAPWRIELNDFTGPPRTKLWQV